MSSPPPRTIVLKSSDGETFQIEEALAQGLQIMKHTVEDGCISIPDVTGNILSKAIDYCRKHVKTADEDKDALSLYDRKFVDVDEENLLDLSKVAKFLGIRSLLNLIYHALSEKIKDKSVEEIRQLFKIKSDFTPEDEAEICNETVYAYE